MNENIQQTSADMARIMNYRMHAEQLFIPVLNGFQIENDNNPQTVLLASGHGYTEQLTSDGHIDDGQFEQRMEQLISKMAAMEGVDEALKAADQMEWVKRMNSIRNRAEEIIQAELIFV